jgi:hypothetical protein
MNMNWNRYSSSNSQPLTIEQIAQRAPSAFATAPHESTSNRFAYIPTSNIIAGMIKSGFQPFEAKQSLCRIDGKQNFTKHMIRFRHASAAEIAVGESVPEIVMINAHDGTSSYKLIGGIYRKICGNGLMVADSTIGSVRIPHFGNILDNVIEGSYRIVSDAERALGVIGQWSQLQLTSGEQSVFAEAAHDLRFADSDGEVKTPIVPAQLLAPRRPDDVGNDLWKTFNRIQENVIKGDLKARTRSGYDSEGRFVPSRKVTTREVKGIDQDVRLNRALWTLAEKMAELRGTPALAA